MIQSTSGGQYAGVSDAFSRSFIHSLLELIFMAPYFVYFLSFPFFGLFSALFICKFNFFLFTLYHVFHQSLPLPPLDLPLALPLPHALALLSPCSFLSFLLNFFFLSPSLLLFINSSTFLLILSFSFTSLSPPPTPIPISYLTLHYSIYKAGGVKALFVGSAARVSWLLPFTTIYLGVYEVSKRRLLAYKKARAAEKKK